MGMPTEEELKMALAEAGRMREHDEDPHHIAKVLLNEHYRLHLLEKVMKQAELLYHSGFAVQEQTKLSKVIDDAKAHIERTGHIEDENYYL